MAGELKFKFKDLDDLDRDFQASTKAVPVIIQRVLTLTLRPVRDVLRSFIPTTTGRMAKSFNLSVRRRRGVITAKIGFLRNRRVSKNTAIASGVLQHGGATPKKGAYLWIPISRNRLSDGAAELTPRQLIDSGHGFVKISKAGNKIAFLRVGDDAFPMFVLKTAVRLSRPPLPIEQRVEGALPKISDEIPETIRSVIEAKRAISSIENFDNRG
jgi:hypothetical protein